MAFALRSAAASLAAQQHSTAPLRCIRCAAARSGFFGVSPVQAARLPKLGGRPGWCLTVALCIFTASGHCCCMQQQWSQLTPVPVPCKGRTASIATVSLFGGATVTKDSIYDYKVKVRVISFQCNSLVQSTLSSIRAEVMVHACRTLTAGTWNSRSTPARCC